VHVGPPLAVGFGLAQPNGPTKSGARPNSLCRPVYGRSRGARSPWRAGDAPAKSCHDRRQGGRGRHLGHDSEVPPRFWGQRDERSSPDGSSTVVCVGRVGRWWGVPPGGCRRGLVGRRGARGRGKARGGEVGPGGRPEAAGSVEVLTEERGRRRLLGCSGRCSPDTLRTATMSGSRSRLASIAPALARPRCSSTAARQTRRCAAQRAERRVASRGARQREEDSKKALASTTRG
jgi:hypothetical protein